MYFNGINSLDELKRQYRRLAMLHHPDVGGDPETMKAINNEHDALFERLKAAQNAAASADATGRTRTTTETAEEFRTVIDLLLKLDGLDVELCGSWLWIGGNTRPHKEQLKAAGCRWSSNKGKWYWHHPEQGIGWHRGRKTTMEHIRARYGSMALRRNAADMAEATA